MINITPQKNIFIALLFSVITLYSISFSGFSMEGDIDVIKKLPSRGKEEFNLLEMNGDIYKIHSSLLLDIPGNFDDLFTALLFIPNFRSPDEAWASPRVNGISFKKYSLTYDGFPVFSGLRPGGFSYFSVSEPLYVQIGDDSGFWGVPQDTSRSINILPDHNSGSSLNLSYFRFSGSSAINKGKNRFYISADGTTANLYVNRIKSNLHLPGIYNIKMEWERKGKRFLIKNLFIGTKSFYSGNVPSVKNIPVKGKVNYDANYSTIGSHITALLTDNSDLSFSFSYNLNRINGSGTNSESPFSVDMDSEIFWSDIAYNQRIGKFTFKVGVNTIYLTKFRGDSVLPIDAHASETLSKNVKGIELSSTKRAAITTGYLNINLQNLNSTDFKAGVKASSIFPDKRVGISPELYFSVSLLKGLEIYSRAQFLSSFSLDAYELMAEKDLKFEKYRNLSAGINLKHSILNLKLEGFMRDYSNLPYFTANIDITNPCNPVISAYAENNKKITSRGIEILAYLLYGDHTLIGSYSYHSTKQFKNGKSFPSEFNHSLRMISINKFGSWKLGTSLVFLSPLYYTPLENVDNIPDLCTGELIYYPVWADKNSETLGNYFRLDFSVSKEFKLKNFLIYAYLDVFNLLAVRNLTGYSYNDDYTVVKKKKSLPPIPVLGLRVLF